VCVCVCVYVCMYVSIGYELSWYYFYVHTVHIEQHKDYSDMLQC